MSYTKFRRILWTLGLIMKAPASRNQNTCIGNGHLCTGSKSVALKRASKQAGNVFCYCKLLMLITILLSSVFPVTCGIPVLVTAAQRELWKIGNGCGKAAEPWTGCPNETSEAHNWVTLSKRNWRSDLISACVGRDFKCSEGSLI